jgi:hypothetical protein
MALARRTRSRSIGRPWLVLLVVVTLVVLVVQGAVSARSPAPARQLAEQSWLDQVVPVIEQSTEQGQEIAEVRADALKLSGTVVASRLGQAATSAETTLGVMNKMPVPRDLQTASSLLLASLAVRAQTAAELSKAMVAALSDKDVVETGSSPTATTAPSSAVTSSTDPGGATTTGSGVPASTGSAPAPGSTAAGAGAQDSTTADSTTTPDSPTADSTLPAGTGPDSTATPSTIPDGTTPVVPTESVTAVAAFEQVAEDMALGDRNYQLFVKSLPPGLGFNPPPSEWLTVPADYSATNLAVFVASLQSAASLVPTVKLQVFTVVTQPAPLAIQRGVNILPDTGDLVLQTVIANTGNQAVSDLTVEATITPARSQPSQTVRQFTSLAPGQTTTVQLGGLVMPTGKPVLLSVHIVAVPGEVDPALATRTVALQMQ